MREIALSLEFLLQYGWAVLIFDDPLVNATVVRQDPGVKPAETLTVPLKPGGGFVARIKLSAPVTTV